RAGPGARSPRARRREPAPRRTRTVPRTHRTGAPLSSRRAMSSTLPGVPDVDEDLASRIVERLGTIELRLRESVSSSDDMMRWTGRHLMDAGGTRVRPMLVLLAASFGDVAADGVQDAAVLVELTHLASLYHDDVMDSAPTRRGTDSAHALWGNNVAILTGDFLFAR